MRRHTLGSVKDPCRREDSLAVAVEDELLADFPAEQSDNRGFSIWILGEVCVPLPALWVLGDQLRTLLPELLEFVGRVLHASHLHQYGDLLQRGDETTRHLGVGRLIVRVELRVQDIGGSCDLAVPIRPTLEPLVQCNLLEVRIGALEELAELEPAGVELAQGGRASVGPSQELEDR